MTDRTGDFSLECIDCGYRLYGLALDGDCPECGHSIAASHEAIHTMSRRDVVALFCRLLAIWLIVEALDLVIQAVGMLVWWATVQPAAAQWNMTYMVLLPTLARLLVAGLIWWQAQRIASWAVPRDGAAFRGASASPGNMLRVGCVLLGLYLVTTGFGFLVGAMLPPPSPSFPGMPVAGALARLLSGLVLLLFMWWRRVLRVIHWLSSFGLKEPPAA